MDIRWKLFLHHVQTLFYRMYWKSADSSACWNQSQPTKTSRQSWPSRLSIHVRKSNPTDSRRSLLSGAIPMRFFSRGGRGRDACRDACKDSCMDACMDACIDAWMHGCMHGCMHRCMHGCMPGCMHGCIHRFMHGCMHGCMDTCMDVCIFACVLRTCLHALSMDA